MPPHCDSMDGPVVSAARRALEKEDVNLVLPYVQESPGNPSIPVRGAGDASGHVDGVQTPKDYPGDYVARKVVIKEDFYRPSNEFD